MWFRMWRYMTFLNWNYCKRLTRSNILLPIKSVQSHNNNEQWTKRSDITIRFSAMSGIYGNCRKALKKSVTLCQCTLHLKADLGFHSGLLRSPPWDTITVIAIDYSLYKNTASPSLLFEKPTWKWWNYICEFNHQLQRLVLWT